MNPEQQQLFDANLAWAERQGHAIARRYPLHIDRDEFIQAARLGLWEAARRFDPATQPNFRRYALRLIHGRILDRVRELGDGRRRCFRDGRDGYGTLCQLDEAGHEEHLARLPEVPAWEGEEAALALLRALPDRDRRLLWRHVALGTSQRALAAEAGLSEDRVNQIISESKRHLRKAHEEAES